MNYRIVVTYVFIIGFFAFLIFSYLNYTKQPTETLIIENSSDRTKQTEEIVISTIKNNPEVIVAALESYQIKKMQEANAQMNQRIQDNLSELDNDPSDPWVGSDNAKIKIVDFFDYNCGFCKRLGSMQHKLIEENSDVKIIFKELPILGEQSVLAAKYSLAVNKVDKSKYLPFHLALLSDNQPKTEAALLAIAGKVGVDLSALKKALQDSDLNQKILDNQALARKIGIHGTPTYIVAGELVQNPTYDAINHKINAVRKQIEAKNNQSGHQDDQETLNHQNHKDSVKH